MKPNPSAPNEAIAQAAADWVLRHDRSLTAAEQDEFSQWLAADARHREAYALQRWGWEEMDRLIGIQTTVHARPDPDLLAPVRRTPARKIIWLGSFALAVAAAVAVGFFALRPSPSAVAAQTVALAAPIEQRTLEDGSIVSLNRGAEIVVNFSAETRRVQLVKGEANFQVAKNKARPFIVSAAGIDVRAVGTAFNVRLGASAVEVLVTEGKVQVDQPASAAGTAAPLLPVLEAGQRTVVSLVLESPAPRVATLSGAEMETRLAWQPRLLDFTDAPLGDIVAEFNRRNPVRLLLADAALMELRFSASFRSDNVEGFVRLMESDFGMRAEWRSGEIVLRKAR